MTARHSPALRFESLEDRFAPAAGDPDPTFGVVGRAVVPFGGAADLDVANAVAVQPDGKVVLAGQVATGTAVNFVVGRLLADGRFDPSFGAGGQVVVPPAQPTPPVATAGNAVAVQPDGKIVAAGHDAGGDLTAVRLNPDGSFDPTFAAGGR